MRRTLMKKLLKRNELRQLELVEYLSNHYDWVQISDVAEALDYSERTLKEDIAYLKDSYNYLSIESSYEGISLTFKQHANIKSFYQSTLERSTPFQLLEILIIQEKLDTDQILETLSISLSTLYRLIKKINNVLEKNFQIKICQNELEFLGNEADIRYFYYIYFSERFPHFNWEFHAINEEQLDILLQSFIQAFKLPVTYSSYMTYKNIVAVNLFRYRQTHKIPIKEEKTKINLKKHLYHLTSLERTLGITLNSETIGQLFYNFIYMNYAQNYQTLSSKMKTDKTLAQNINWLGNSLDELSEKYNILLPNKNDLIVSISNASHCERFTPRSGYLLYDHVRADAQRFKENLPNFSKDALNILTQFRKTVDQPLTKYTMDFLFYIFCLEWRDLIFTLQNIRNKVKVLIISDYSLAHAALLKQTIEYSFPNQLEIDTLKSPKVANKMAHYSSYDIFIANFPLTDDPNFYKISIENTLTMKDFNKIEKAIINYYKSNNIQNYFMKN